MQKFCKWLLLLLFLVSLPVMADTLISISTPNPFNALSVNTDQVLATAWYLPQSYDSVRITANLWSDGGTYSAYLMDAIGPQATALGNQIASTTFTAGIAPSDILLWNGLSLGPGFYYLVIGSTDPASFGAWSSEFSPTVALAPGVVQGDGSGVQFYAFGTDVNTGYLPASAFLIDDSSSGGQLLYSVSTAPVPEPSTLLLLLSGSLSWGLTKIRRRRPF